MAEEIVRAPFSVKPADAPKAEIFCGLDAARHLYEANGFRLVDEFDGDQWGRPVRERIFERAA